LSGVSRPARNVSMFGSFTEKNDAWQ
jgi:hypothetical protein